MSFLQPKDFVRSVRSGVFGHAETVSGADMGEVLWREVLSLYF